ncbi:MAG: lysophospholipid acyltransferase family protein [Pirellula staleyi]
MTSKSVGAGSIVTEARVVGRRMFYRCMRLICRMIAVVAFGLRTEGRHHLNFEGGGMLLSTHQSLMDPVLVGIVSNRRLNYLARKTLFKNPAFALLIRLLDAIEIDRERGGLAGLREMLKRLQGGEWVLMFPEGTRTSDGEVAEIKPGFTPVARRSQVPIVPIAIVGAYDCLPKGEKLPTRKPIAVVVGEPMLADTYMSMTDTALMEELNQRLRKLHTRGRELVPAK